MGESYAPLRLRPKGVGLLARVALADRPLERRTLAGELFPDVQDPLADLRWYLSHLRAVLPRVIADAVHADRSAVSFRGTTDVRRFREGAEKILEHPESPAAPRTLALYRGDLCEALAISAGPTFDTWLYVEQEALRRRFRQAVVRYAHWATDVGAPGRALPFLGRLVQVDPYYEEAHVLLIESVRSEWRRQGGRSELRTLRANRARRTSRRAAVGAYSAIRVTRRRGSPPSDR